MKLVKQLFILKMISIIVFFTTPYSLLATCILFITWLNYVFHCTNINLGKSTKLKHQ